MKDRPVHATAAREKTVTRTIRMPLSLLKQIEAVQAKRGDEYLNDAAVVCISVGVDAVLRNGIAA